MLIIIFNNKINDIHITLFSNDDFFNLNSRINILYLRLKKIIINEFVISFIIFFKCMNISLYDYITIRIKELEIFKI